MLEQDTRCALSECDWSHRQHCIPVLLKVWTHLHFLFHYISYKHMLNLYILVFKCLEMVLKESAGDETSFPSSEFDVW